MTEPTSLEKLQQRVGDGIVWLDEHDPKGVYHLWFEAGLTPASRLPEDARREEYRAYYPARLTFERLDRELAKVDATWSGNTQLGDPRMQWQPEKGKR